MKTRITWHIDGIVDSNKNASLVTTSDEPHIVQKALKSFAPTSNHPHAWPLWSGKDMSVEEYLQSLEN